MSSGLDRRYRFRVCHVTVTAANTKMARLHDAHLLLGLVLLDPIDCIVFRGKEDIVR